MQSIRVGSLNVWGMFADWPARLEALRAHELTSTFDVVLAQEVCRNDEIDQLQQLSEAFDLPHTYFHSDKKVRGMDEGVAILSREPLSTVGMTNLGQGRVLIQADGYGGTTFASAHLSFEGRERTEQVKALLKRVTLKHVILGADFNGHLSTFEEALDKYWYAPTDVAPTWPVCGPDYFSTAWAAHTGRLPHFSLEPRRMDYILTRGVEVLDPETAVLEHGGVYVSDHAFIYSTMLLPES